MEKKIILSFPYNLSASNAKERVEGKVTLYESELTVEEKGKEIIELSLSSVEEFIYDAGIGCVAVEAIVDGKYITLCRADMVYAKNISAAV